MVEHFRYGRLVHRDTVDIISKVDSFIDTVDTISKADLFVNA